MKKILYFLFMVIILFAFLTACIPNANLVDATLSVHNIPTKPGFSDCPKCKEIVRSIEDFSKTNLHIKFFDYVFLTRGPGPNTSFSDVFTYYNSKAPAAGWKFENRWSSDTNGTTAIYYVETFSYTKDPNILMAVVLNAENYLWLIVGTKIP